jgi:uncharacterized membrane protein
MSKRTHKHDRSKVWRTRLKRFLVTALLITVLIALALGTLFYLRPIATMTVAQRGLLRLSGGMWSPGFVGVS